MRTLALTTALFATALFATAVLAEPPSAEQMAKLQYDVKKATDAVDKKYEGRQLSADERKQQMKERAAAESSVLEKAGVDRKDYVHADAKMSKSDRETVKAETEKLEKKDKAGSQPQGGNKEVVIEKGGKGEMTPEQEAAEMDKAMGFGKSSGGGGKRKR